MDINSYYEESKKKINKIISSFDSNLNDINYKNKINQLDSLNSKLLHLENAIYKNDKNKSSSVKHKISDIISYVDAEFYGDLDGVISGVSIDSRLVIKNNLFFAIKGEHENGEKYIEKAFENGASYVFASKDYVSDDKRIIRVCDTLEALKKIAISYKNKIGAKVLAITGSVGKTTCKNLAYSILSRKYKVAKTFANYNTVTGISMSILDMPLDTEIIILELGVDTIGEMKELVKIADPDFALISNIASSHLERFGTVENIFKEKIQLVSNFSKEACLVLNGESQYLSNFESDKFEVIKLFNKNSSFEKKERVAYISDFSVSRNGTKFKLELGGISHVFETSLFGEHVAFDAALVILICEKMGVPIKVIKEKIIECEQDAMRFDLLDVDSFIIINDAYNSSFKSLESSIKTARLLAENKLFVCMGDILEIGENPNYEHSLIGEKVSKLNIDEAIFFGPLMKNAYETYSLANKSKFDEIEECASYILKKMKKGDVLLVKASRGIKLERLSNFISLVKLNEKIDEL